MRWKSRIIIKYQPHNRPSTQPSNHPPNHPPVHPAIVSIINIRLSRSSTLWSTSITFSDRYHYLSNGWEAIWELSSFILRKDTKSVPKWINKMCWNDSSTTAVMWTFITNIITHYMLRLVPAASTLEPRRQLLISIKIFISSKDMLHSEPKSKGRSCWNISPTTLAAAMLKVQSVPISTTIVLWA